MDAFAVLVTVTTRLATFCPALCRNRCHNMDVNSEPCNLELAESKSGRQKQALPIGKHEKKFAKRLLGAVNRTGTIID